ncbi:hypothetical protein [Tissierella praeacuta]|uniref:hypothetical protein n=1 Tax=Tissierella praeacuta TaxID=43131 RepID=UPI00334109F9
MTLKVYFGEISAAPNLSQLILNSGSDNLGEGNSSLAASSPMVSGMGSLLLFGLNPGSIISKKEFLFMQLD